MKLCIASLLAKLSASKLNTKHTIIVKNYENNSKDTEAILIACELKLGNKSGCASAKPTRNTKGLVSFSYVCTLILWPSSTLPDYFPLDSPFYTIYSLIIAISSIYVFFLPISSLLVYFFWYYSLGSCWDARFLIFLQFFLFLVLGSLLFFATDLIVAVANIFFHTSGAIKEFFSLLG